MTFYTRSTCPECGSTDVLVGNFLLQCFTCGWCYLNKYSCRMCGDKSVSAVGNSKEILYGCKDHPISAEERTRLFSEFVEAVGT